MHSLFVTTQFVALASYLALQCGEHGFQESVGSTCNDEEFLTKTILNFVGSSLLTPFFPNNVVSSPYLIYFIDTSRARKNGPQLFDL